MIDEIKSPLNSLASFLLHSSPPQDRRCIRRGEINWKKVKNQFEKEMFDKLKGLPGHREVSEELRKFRNIISHELPETAPKALFQRLIKLLFSGEKIYIRKVKKMFLNPELKKEKQLLARYKVEFKELKKSAKNWVKKNLPEEKLQKMWKAHETWLPRRYTIYKRQPAFQKIAADTLARFCLINKYE